MAQSLRDANQVTTKTGVFSGSPLNLKIENATGYLKVSATLDTFSAPTVATNLAKHDDNGVPSETGSFNGVVKPILIQNSSGRVRCVVA